MEEWKSLKNIVECGDNYEVSNLGNVRNIITRRILKPSRSNKGYLVVKLCRNGKGSNFLIHRLVAMVFIPNLENKQQVNHIDSIRDNNELSNLEWCTNSENQQHSISKGLSKKQIGEDRPASKLTEEDVIEIRELYSTNKYSQRKLANMFNVGQRTIATIVNRITWKHI